MFILQLTTARVKTPLSLLHVAASRVKTLPKLLFKLVPVHLGSDVTSVTPLVINCADVQQLDTKGIFNVREAGGDIFTLHPVWTQPAAESSWTTGTSQTC